MEENKEDVSSTVVNNYYNNHEQDEYNEQEERSISFSQIWRMIKKHWVALIIFTVAGLAGGAVYGFFIKEAQYESTARIIVKNNEADSTEFYDSFNIARQKAQIACDYMTTLEVMEATCKAVAPEHSSYDITDTEKKDKTIEKLAKQYSVGVSSLFVNVTVTTKEKQLSIDLANAFVEVTYDLCNSTAAVSSVLKDQFTISKTSVSIDKSTSNAIIIVVGGVIGLVVGCAYAIIRELADPRVRSKYDLEQLTGVKVLGMIPQYASEEASKEGQSNE